MGLIGSSSSSSWGSEAWLQLLGRCVAERSEPGKIASRFHTAAICDSHRFLALLTLLVCFLRCFFFLYFLFFFFVIPLDFVLFMWYWIKLYCIVRCPIAIVTTVLDALNKRHRYVYVLLPYQRPKKGRVKGAFDKADVGVQWTVDNGHWDCGMWGCGAMYCMFYFWFRRIYNGQLLRKAGSWLAIAYLFNTISFGPITGDVMTLLHCFNPLSFGYIWFSWTADTLTTLCSIEQHNCQVLLSYRLLPT